MAGSDKPRTDFSDVTSGSSTTRPAAGQSRTVTVKSGDSLSKIAKAELGDASQWKAIYEANKDKIKDPDLIHPGQVLDIPSNL
jgi:nucleoid-associated protein YgaU